LVSLSGNVALSLWAYHQARLAAEQQAQIESLRREIRDLRRQLQEMNSPGPDPVLLQKTMDTI
jgi:cell division protein FtsB